jgi:hypothetical protein
MSQPRPVRYNCFESMVKTEIECWKAVDKVVLLVRAREHFGGPWTAAGPWRARLEGAPTSTFLLHDSLLLLSFQPQLLHENSPLLLIIHGSRRMFPHSQIYFHSLHDGRARRALNVPLHHKT